MSDVGEQVDSPRVHRMRTEDGFGARLRGWISTSGARFVDVAASLGMRREDLYEVMDGSKHFRGAWTECLPAAVELLYLRERAAHHGCELAPIGNADAGTMSTVVAETSDVQRGTVMMEADGHITVAEADAGLIEIREARRALADREALLNKVIAERGLRVVSR